MLNKSIIKIRNELQKTNLKKSGKNKFAGFEYYELSDFLPTLNQLMLSEGVNDLFSISGDTATLTLIKDEEKQTYSMPFTQFVTPTNKNGAPSMQDIQYLGALNTYYKRYLYLNAFGITDGEVIVAMDATMPMQQKLNGDQVEAINTLIDNAENLDMAGFLKYANAEKVEDIKDDVYPKLVAMLKKKQKKD